MKTAVLYARYSCSKQREVSIEDQLEACYKYCESREIEVVNVYSDYAISGKTDHRPDFQRMISNAPESDYVVVYMMERFSRDKYDPSIYKKQLEDKGVRVISALEYIPNAPEGILIEKILEGQAAYFSMDVARKTRRGMESNARKAMNNGGTPSHLVRYFTGSRTLQRLRARRFRKGSGLLILGTESCIETLMLQQFLAT